MRVDVNLQDVDIDQCSSDGWFAGTHRCNATTMEVSDPAAAETVSYTAKAPCYQTVAVLEWLLAAS